MPFIFTTSIANLAILASMIYIYCVYDTQTKYDTQTNLFYGIVYIIFHVIFLFVIPLLLTKQYPNLPIMLYTLLIDAAQIIGIWIYSFNNAIRIDKSFGISHATNFEKILICVWLSIGIMIIFISLFLLSVKISLCIGCHKYSSIVVHSVVLIDEHLAKLEFIS